MSNRPRATIAIANFNGAKFLERTVASVLAQTAVDVKVLVVDNASTDTSCSIVEAIDDPRLQLRRFDKHVNVTANWNRSIVEATTVDTTADFASLLHSDDVWEATFLEHAIDAIERHGVDVALGNTRVIDGNDAVIERATFRRKQRNAERVFDDSDRDRLLAEMDVFPCSWVARRAFLSHLRFDERFQRAPDWEFWLRVFERPQGIVAVPAAWSRYRIHGSNDTFTPATIRGMRDDEITIISEAMARQPVTNSVRRRARRMVDVRMAIRCAQVIARGDWRTAGSLLSDMRRTAGTRGLLRAWLNLALLPETRLAVGDLLYAPVRRWKRTRQGTI